MSYTAVIVICLLAAAPTAEDCNKDKSRMVLYQDTKGSTEEECMKQVKAFLLGAEVWGVVDSDKDGFRVFCTSSLPL